MKKSNISRILTMMGSMILVLLILLCMPFSVPKLFGLQLFSVESESMEPAYPVGSVIYVKECEADAVQVGDAITYTLGTDTSYVMTHRVTRIDEESQTFITKGDANQIEDAEPVAFRRLIGTPVFCIRRIAVVSNFINSSYGVPSMIGIFIFVFLLFRVSDYIGKKQNSLKSKYK